MLARVMIVAMALLGLSQHAFAGCTCSRPGGECGRGWSSGQVIFLGKVTANIATEAPVVEDSEETSAEVLFPGAVQNLPMNHEVHFSIAESFRGEGQLGQEIVVHTGVDERGRVHGCVGRGCPGAERARIASGHRGDKTDEEERSRHSHRQVLCRLRSEGSRVERFGDHLRVRAAAA